MINKAMSAKEKDKDLQKQIAVLMLCCHGLIQKEKVDIDMRKVPKLTLQAKRL